MLPLAESCGAFIMWSGDHWANRKRFISTSANHVATKRDRMMTSDE